MTRRPGRGADRSGADGGSATLWVVACIALLLLVTEVAVVRAAAVVARHRAESGADLAALAAAGRIGVGGDACAAAARVAAANGVRLQACAVRLAADGRSGSVRTRVTLRVHLPVVGARQVVAGARAGRLPA
ncbi:Rv3654c family TadE-like protein [uncultured Jatrophihabitans sp.]|uniref:Rv3654c family TadE-like protein n=1 Tax=uncultured Jatrophihabitans sp. TaxID=1610747 RepID=UPI0035CAE7B7